MKIIVEKVKPVKSVGCLRAYVDVRLADLGILIKECRVVQQPGQKAWVSMPQREWTDVHGKKCYKPIIECSAQIYREISAAVLNDLVVNYVMGAGE